MLILGYEGRLCEINHDDCEHIVCNNQGTCIDGVNEFRCSCTERFTGRYCEVSRSICQSLYKVQISWQEMRI